MILNCCGKKLVELTEDITSNENVAGFDIEKDKIKIENIEDDIFVSIDHSMKKSHFISFIAYVTSDKLMINKLYPEQNACTRFKRCGHGIIYVFCNKHGISSKRI